MSLKVEGLQAHYGKSHVLHGVSLDVGAGETVCLIGRNGVGKSTTLKSIMGLLRPSAGAIYWRGERVDSWPPHRLARAGIGYVPEERRVFPTVTVAENLSMGEKRPAGGGAVRWTKERVYSVFPRLAERQAQRADTLSGGEQQMLSIARTLVGNPDLILVDEPTEGLAPMIVERVEHALREAAADGTAILLVEQAVDLVLALASRAYVMAKGAIVFDGKAGDLATDAALRKSHLEI